MNRNIKIRMVFTEKKRPYLLDISPLLYDFELLHDFSLLISDIEDYRNYKFSQYFWYRNGRPIKNEYRIRALKIVKESPLTIELILSTIAVASGAIWIIIQALEKISNLKLNREKLKLETKKLKLKINKAYYDEEIAKIELENKLREREITRRIFISLIERLEKNPINLENFEINGILVEEEK